MKVGEIWVRKRQDATPVKIIKMRWLKGAYSCYFGINDDYIIHYRDLDDERDEQTAHRKDFIKIFERVYL